MASAALYPHTLRPRQPPIGWLKLEASWNIDCIMVTWCVQCVSTMLCVGSVHSHAVLCNTMRACLQCSAMQV